MEFTGERYVPELMGKIRVEHYHRYASIIEIVRGKKILDAACGDGYGSFLLASYAKEITGIDIEKQVVDEARKKYKKENLNFQNGSVLDLPFKKK